MLGMMDAVERFSEVVASRRPALDAGALAIAAGADPELDASRWLAELDRLAAGIDSLDALRHRIFVEECFAGNADDYYEPGNSLLHQVLRRRIGIPITLSVVCIEVGRRCGIPLQGIGMPGHFLLGVVGVPRYLDAFRGGRELDLAGCEALFRASTGSEARFGPHLLHPTPVPAILIRILENLRVAYRMRSRAVDLEWVLRMRLALPSSGTPELLELARTMGQQGRFLEAARLLASRAEESPHDAEFLTRAARSLRAHLN